MSVHSFTEQLLSVRVERARDPGAVARGVSPSQIRSWAPVSSRRVSLASLYAKYLPSIRDYLDPWPVWSAGDVRYETAAHGRGAMRALQQPSRPSIYRGQTSSEFGIPGELLIPPEDRDQWFRRVTEHRDAYPARPGSNYRFKQWNEVGRYDPTCIPGFNTLAGGSLETYSFPQVHLPDGASLGPTRSMGGYVHSPPLLLTTLDGAAWLADWERYRGESGAAFISSVRVRVAGTGVAGPVSEARLERVAERIRESTGLAVDIAKGASTRDVDVTLPAGRFGRPELTVAESWWSKGAAIRFVKAVRGQDLALFALVLVGAAVLIGESTFMAVRRRRSEFGVLRALGWPAFRIAGLVEAETIVLGVAAGTASAGLGLVLRATVLHALPTGLAIVSIPLGVAVAAVAGVFPALSAARGSTVSVIRGRSPVRRSRPPRFSAGLGLRDLRRERRLESLLGIGAVALGAGLSGAVVLAARAFRGRLDVTTLGTFLGSRVHPFHVALAAMALAFGAIAAGQIVMLGYIEREREFGVLRSVGWPRSRVLAVLLAQGLAMVVGGGLVGGAAVVVGARAVGEPGAAAIQGAVAGMIAAAAATALAVAGPMILAYRASPARAVGGE